MPTVLFYIAHSRNETAHHARLLMFFAPLLFMHFIERTCCLSPTMFFNAVGCCK